jgi:hypothetical protein
MIAIDIGYTFLSRNVEYPTKHLYIVISPIIEEKILIVNVTSKKEKSDLSCILQKGVHDFLRHDSVVNYRDATDADVKNVIKAVQCNLFEPQKSISSALLARIHKGALISPTFKPKYLKYIP